MALPKLVKKPRNQLSVIVEEYLTEWFESDIALQLLEKEQEILDEVLPKLFGYHLLQAGTGILPNSMDNCPVNHKFRLSPHEKEPGYHLARYHKGEPIELYGRLDQLPISNNSVDGVVLHHNLEYEVNIHQVLRESSRVLMPGGSMVIIGFNPWSIWGVWKRLGIFRSKQGPWKARFVSPHRLSEWLELLDFEVEGCEYSFYSPPLTNPRWLKSFQWWEDFCEKWLSRVGAFYVLVAKKRVSCVTPIRSSWRDKVPHLVPVPMPQANRHIQNKQNPQEGE